MSSFFDSLVKIFNPKASDKYIPTPPVRIQRQYEAEAKPKPQAPVDKIKFWIEYEVVNNRITLNELFELRQPNMGSENDRVFQFLYNNPNKTHNLSKIEKELGSKLKKPLHKIVEDLGFTKGLRKAFFKVSMRQIRFRNPVREACLKKLGINKIKLI